MNPGPNRWPAPCAALDSFSGTVCEVFPSLFGQRAYLREGGTSISLNHFPVGSADGLEYHVLGHTLAWSGGISDKAIIISIYRSIRCLAANMFRTNAVSARLTVG